MNYEVVFCTSFRRSIKKLEKRYPSVRKDVKLAIEVLLENPNLGMLIPGALGVRKFRIKNSDSKRGKSGSYRLLYYVEDIAKTRICLLLIYAKSDKENITSEEIREILQEIENDLKPYST